MKLAFPIGAVFALVLGVCQPASANVIYSFIGTLSGPFDGGFGPDLVVTDAAAASGSMKFTISLLGLTCGPTSPPYPQVCDITGDPSGFVSLTNNSFSPTTGSGFFFGVDLLFNPN